MAKDLSNKNFIEDKQSKKRIREDLLSVYIHVPYCLSKCAYCAFNSRPAINQEEVSNYIRAVGREISFRSTELQNKIIYTIYFGGGTPSICSSNEIEFLIEQVRLTAGSIPENTEITIEGNPDTLSLIKLRALRTAGVNRISIGVQTFNEGALSFLGRNHTNSEAEFSIQRARECGFENVGLDLIIGLPAPFTIVYKNDIEKAIELFPEHLSVYMLGIEEPSELFNRFSTGQFSPISDDLYAELFTQCDKLLCEAGYEHYEVSNYSLPGFASQHNNSYWNGLPYLGFGAGAHSYLTSEARPIRKANYSDPNLYIESLKNEKDPVDFSETITVEMEVRERLMLALRTAQGVRPNDFGSHAFAIKTELEKLAQNDLYEREGDRFLPTVKGYLVADGVAVSLWEKLFG